MRKSIPYIPKELREEIYEFKGEKDECDYITNYGSRCGYALKYKDENGNIKDCSKYCKKNINKWIKEMISNPPSSVVMKNDSYFDADTETSNSNVKCIDYILIFESDKNNTEIKNLEIEYEKGTYILKNDDSPDEVNENFLIENLSHPKLLYFVIKITMEPYRGLYRKFEVYSKGKRWFGKGWEMVENYRGLYPIIQMTMFRD